MERVEIHVPERLWPKKDPTKDCPCQKREMVLKRKQGTLKWLKQPGDLVQVGEPVCEAEVEKKVFEFPAPCSGTLVECCIEDEGEFKYKDVLGYIEKAM